MTTINSNRITGLATGMDIDEMVTNMLTGEQSKIDKAEQKKTTQTWQQEIYRDVITDVKGLYDKYFTATSADYILGSKTFSTVNVTSSNSSIITAVAGAGAGNINYQFEVQDIAEAPKMVSESKFEVNGSTIELTKKTQLSDLGVVEGTSFKFNSGEGKDTEVITIESDDTIESLVKKINDASGGEIIASFSEMTGKFTIESKTTGATSTLKVVDVEEDADGKFVETSAGTTSGLSFLGIDGTQKSGQNSKIIVSDSSGVEIKTIEGSSNTFTIDDITYTVHGQTKTDESVNLTSAKDTQKTVDKMKEFLEEYNSMIDNIYGLVTEKKDNDYPPLTDAQKEEMSETEIEKWEAKAKTGVLRNDSELRRFLEDMKATLFGEIEGAGVGLSDIGITSVSNYNKPGQIALDEDMFKKALEENGDQVYKVVTGTLEKMKTVTYSYAGSSSSVFAKKAGIEKTATAVNNLFSEQIKKQEEYIKKLITKMEDKQEKLYLKFANLESSMNSLNSQMNYLISSLS